MTVNIYEAKKSMRLTFASGKAYKLDGGPGIGKSEISEQYAAEQRALHGRYFYNVFNVATANLASAMGFLVPFDVTHGDLTFKAGSYTYPESFFDRETQDPAYTYERGMLVFEEWGQGQGDVKRALATCIHERRLGRHRLPSNFDILILSNRPEDRSGVTKEFDFLINRWNQQTLRAELEPWVDHSLQIGVSETSIAFATQNVETVFASKVPERQGPWCTPRSLVGADRFLQAALADGMSVDDPLLTLNLEGMIGTGATAQYMAFVRLRDKLPKFADIINNPATTMMPEAIDALMLVVYALAGRVDQTTLKPVVQYMRRAPQAFAMTFVKGVLRRSPQLIHTKEMGDWARDNVALLAAIQ